MPNKSNKKLHLEIVRQMLTLATSGFGLVAALAWNNVIQEFVNSYIKIWLPGQSGIISLLIYAIAITILAVNNNPRRLPHNPAFKDFGETGK
ncbi:hypothetical protein HYT17_00870 [Candidatus Microgenomates bacterium]|nr:hypothetical protein [Candidatus Microgenomates bacterium]